MSSKCSVKTKLLAVHPLHTVACWVLLLSILLFLQVYLLNNVKEYEDVKVGYNSTELKPDIKMTY